MLGRQLRQNEKGPVLILVDTSVWIDFFDHPHSPHAKELKRLIEADADICLIDINLTEILQGIKDEKMFDLVKSYLTKFPIIRTINLDIFIQAANIYRACRRKGKTVSTTVDGIIAAVAIENSLLLFHKDKDFDSIAACTSLKIHKMTD